MSDRGKRGRHRELFLRYQRSRAMGLFSKSIETRDDLFAHTLQDMSYAENQIAKSLPKMVEKAHDPTLRKAAA